MTIEVIDLGISFLCPHCGCLVHDETVNADDGLDCGTTLECPACGALAIVDVRTLDERKRSFEDAGAVDALREMESAAYAFAMAATVKMNETIDEFPRLVQALAGARAILQPEVKQCQD